MGEASTADRGSDGNSNRRLLVLETGDYVKQSSNDEFSFARASFGTYGSATGGVLLGYGLFAYFIPTLPGTDASALLLINGFLLFVLGLAFKYAELPPLECATYASAESVRSQATPTQQQIKGDVTRFRYGEEAHLQEALDRIFNLSARGGIRERDAPVAIGLREQAVDGKYTLVLQFRSKKVPLEEWTKRQQYIASFFGPGVDAVAEDAGDNIIELGLISQGGDASTGVQDDEYEVLPPLVPGAPPRYRKKDKTDT